MKPRKRRNPFCRPWMGDEWVASGGSNMLKALVAGGITGGLEACISYPTEFAKTKLQLDEQSGKKRQYTGFLDVVRKTVAEKGFTGMYRGLSTVLCFSIPKIATRFAAFESLKGLSADERGNLSPLMRVLCGLGAGVSEAIFVVTPMETIKVKFIHDGQKSVPQYKGFIHGVSQIVKAEGPRGLYQGLTPTILRQGSNQAIRFYVMETFKFRYRRGDPDVPIPKYVVVGFGLVSAVASVLGNTPIDVIKTRMQGLEAKKYKNTLDCFLKIWKNEGPLAFYKGTSARMIRVGLESGFIFMFFDTTMEYLNKIWP